jgi:hypothetical protein
MGTSPQREQHSGRTRDVAIPDIWAIVPSFVLNSASGRKSLSRMVIRRLADRSWEQGEDPSVLDFKLNEYGKQSKTVIADRADRKRWVKLGKRPVIRKSGLSQTTVFAILKGETVRRTTLAIFTRAING